MTILQDYQNGLTLKAIARKLNLTLHHIKIQLKNANIPIDSARQGKRTKGRQNVGYKHVEIDDFKKDFLNTQMPIFEIQRNTM